jgi:WD40 repeat protein
MKYGFPLAAWLLLVAVGGCKHRLAPVREFAIPSSPVKAYAWSRDGKLVAFGETNGTVTVWNVDSGALLGRTEGYVPNQIGYETTGLALAADDDLLAFGTTGNVIRLWNFRANATRDLAALWGPLLVAAFTPGNKRLIAASGGMSYPPPTTASTTPGPGVFAHRSPPVIQRMTVVAFDVGSGDVVSRVDASGFINMALSPDGELFAGTKIAVTDATTTWPVRMGSPEIHGGEVQVRRTSDGELVQHFPANAWWNAFSPDGVLLRAGLDIWNARTGKHVCQVPINARTFSDGGKRMLVVSSGSPPFTLWPVVMVPLTSVRLGYVNVNDGTTRDVGEFDAPPRDQISSAFGIGLSFSPDGKLLVDRQMHLWRVPR